MTKHRCAKDPQIIDCKEVDLYIRNCTVIMPPSKNFRRRKADSDDEEDEEITAEVRWLVSYLVSYMVSHSLLDRVKMSDGYTVFM